jgi:hypothetical protein
MTKKKILKVVSLSLVSIGFGIFIFSAIYFWQVPSPWFFSNEKNKIISHHKANGDYRCCLEKACTYCIEKSPGHGEGATCDCLSDVVEGRHPCGECIGEILEGHGNKYLSKYFASSIAEEVGQEHLPTLKKIISQKYNIDPEEQI